MSNENSGEKTVTPTVATKPAKHSVAAYNEDTILTGKRLLVVFIAM